MSTNLNRKITAMLERIRAKQDAMQSTQAVYIYRTIDGLKVIEGQQDYETRLSQGLPIVLIPENGR